MHSVTTSADKKVQTTDGSIISELKTEERVGMYENSEINVLHKKVVEFRLFHNVKSCYIYI